MRLTFRKTKKLNACVVAFFLFWTLRWDMEINSILVWTAPLNKTTIVHVDTDFSAVKFWITYIVKMDRPAKIS